MHQPRLHVTLHDSALDIDGGDAVVVALVALIGPEGDVVVGPQDDDKDQKLSDDDNISYYSDDDALDVEYTTNLHALMIKQIVLDMNKS